MSRDRFATEIAENDPKSATRTLAPSGRNAAPRAEFRPIGPQPPCSPEAEVAGSNPAGRAPFYRSLERNPLFPASLAAATCSGPLAISVRPKQCSRRPTRRHRAAPRRLHETRRVGRVLATAEDDLDYP